MKSINMEELQDASLAKLFRCLIGIYSHGIGMMLKKYHLKPPAAGMLFVARKLGNPSQKDIAEEMNVTAPSITMMVRRLEEGGFLTREPDTEDQRIVRIRLTDKGNQAADEMNQIRRTMDEHMFHNITVEEQVILRRVILQMIGNVKSSSMAEPGHCGQGEEKMDLW